MTELAIEYVRPGDLVAYDRNARLHSPEQVAQLAAWIGEVGFLVPVLLDDAGVLIAGHGRREAALKLGLDQIPAIRASHLTPSQAKAMRLADNQFTMSSTYDLDKLSAEVKELNLEEFDISKLGFTDRYLEALLGDNEEALEEAHHAEDVAQMRGPARAAPEGGTGGDPGDGRYKSQFGVIVMCSDEAHQRQVYEQLRAEGMDCKVVVT